MIKCNDLHLSYVYDAIYFDTYEHTYIIKRYGNMKGNYYILFIY